MLPGKSLWAEEAAKFTANLKCCELFIQITYSVWQSSEKFYWQFNVLTVNCWKINTVYYVNM